MSLFDRMAGGGSSSGAHWQVDVLTLDYLFSGEVDEAGQKWGWVYLQLLAGSEPARAFELIVTAERATGALPAPGFVGGRAAFTWGSALVALLPRDGASIATWAKWNAQWPTLTGTILTGPYRVTGTISSTDGTMPTALLSRFVAVRDATITRVDGAGGGEPISAERALFLNTFLHTGVATG